jgi:hypothetical protein
MAVLGAVVSVSDISSAGAPFSAEQICKAGVAALMGRDPAIMKVTRKENGIVHLYYIRQDDGTMWAYRCTIEGARIIWASDTGRWRTQRDDEKITYRASGDMLTIIQTFTDGTGTAESFKRSQLDR